MILAPLVRKIESADACTTEKESRIFGFRAVYVFDVSQTDGTPLPTIGVAQGNPGEYFTRLTCLFPLRYLSLTTSGQLRKRRECKSKMGIGSDFTTSVTRTAAR